VVKDESGNIIRRDFLGTNVYIPLTKIIEVGPAVAAEEPLPEVPLEGGEVTVPEGDGTSENKPEEENNETVAPNEPVSPDAPSEGENTDLPENDSEISSGEETENIGENNEPSSENSSEEVKVPGENTPVTEDTVPEA